MVACDKVVRLFVNVLCLVAHSVVPDLRVYSVTHRRRSSSRLSYHRSRSPRYLNAMPLSSKARSPHLTFCMTSPDVQIAVSLVKSFRSVLIPSAVINRIPLPRTNRNLIAATHVASRVIQPVNVRKSFGCFCAH